MYRTNGGFLDVVHQHAQGTRQLDLALYRYLAGQFGKTPEWVRRSLEVAECFGRLAQVSETFLVCVDNAAVVLYVTFPLARCPTAN